MALWNRIKIPGFFTLRDRPAESGADVVLREDVLSLFVDFKDVNGRRLAFTGIRLDWLLDYLKSYSQDGTTVFLAAADGQIWVHPDAEIMGQTYLATLYDSEIASSLLRQSGSNSLSTDEHLLASTHIPGMNWYVIVAVEDEVVLALVRSRHNTIIFASLVLFVLAIVVSLAVSGALIAALQRVSNTLVDIGEGEGDLSQRLDAKGAREIRQIGDGLNRFVEVIQNLVIQVRETVHGWQDSSVAAASTATQTRDDVGVHRERTELVATAIEEMGAAVVEVAGNANEASKITQEVTDDARIGLTKMDSARTLMDQLAVENENIVEGVQLLADTSGQMGSILEVIRSISEQTNLLALNAPLKLRARESMAVVLPLLQMKCVVWHSEPQNLPMKSSR